MIDKSRWEVPAAQQPRPEELGYDLDQALQSIVTVHAEIPDDAFTAKILGNERAGSGVVIRDTGLVLTIGYLVTEAENVLLATANERIVPAHPIAIDQESGLALVQALGALDLPAMALGQARAVGVGEPVIMAGGGGGRKQAVRARMVGKEEFSGYWEYHLREALFTRARAPAVGRRRSDWARRGADRNRLLACAAVGRARKEPGCQYERSNRPAAAGD